MKRRDFIRTTSAGAIAASLFPLSVASAEDARPKKVLYYSRSAGFEHSAVKRFKPDQLSYSENVLTEMLKKQGIELECTKDGTVFDGDLTQYGAFAFYATGNLTGQNSNDGGKPMSESGKKRMLAAINDGMGVVGFHAATDCSRTPKDKPTDPYALMMGAQFCGHGAQQEAEMKVVSPKFPGMKAAGESFVRMEEWYAMDQFVDDLHVILKQETWGMTGDQYDRPSFPATWAHMVGKGRVYYTSLGHREDIWDDELCQAVMMSGVNWSLGLANADVTPNIKKVTPGANELKRS